MYSTEQGGPVADSNLDDVVDGLVSTVKQEAPFSLAVDITKPLGVPETADIWLESSERDPSFCITLTPAWPTVRILCEGYVFDDVIRSHVAEFVYKLLTRRAKVRTFGLMAKSVALTVEVGNATYVASRRFSGGLSGWEGDMLGRG
jgi:hypothetical protein